MADDATDRLYDGKSYKVYRNGRFDFTVTAPSGRIVACRLTIWGARRAIRRHMRRETRGGWWDAPIVVEVDVNGER